MYEDEDDGFNVKPPQAPALPGDIYNKLFTRFQQLENLRYPGGAAFAKLDDNARDLSDFVVIRNPLERSALARLQRHLNPPRARRRRALDALPPAMRADDGTRGRGGRQAAAALGSVRVSPGLPGGGRARAGRQCLIGRRPGASDTCART